MNTDEGWDDDELMMIYFQFITTNCNADLEYF